MERVCVNCMHCFRLDERKVYFCGIHGEMRRNRLEKPILCKDFLLYEKRAECINCLHFAMKHCEKDSISYPYCKLEEKFLFRKIVKCRHFEF